jgi:hypothetical protein
MDPMTEDQKNSQAVANLIEVLQRFGTVKRPASGKVIPFPATLPSSKKT